MAGLDWEKQGSGPLRVEIIKFADVAGLRGWGVGNLGIIRCLKIYGIGGLKVWRFVKVCKGLNVRRLGGLTIYTFQNFKSWRIHV